MYFDLYIVVIHLNLQDIGRLIKKLSKFYKNAKPVAPSNHGNGRPGFLEYDVELVFCDVTGFLGNGDVDV